MHSTAALLVAVAAAMVVLLGGGAHGVSMCNMNQEGLMACKPSVTPPPPEPVDPSAACCDALRGADLECLCSYKGSLMLPSLGIDPDLALSLPPKCNIPLPAGC